MRIVNEMNSKPLWIKNGLDFAKEFNKRVVNISKNCSLVMVVFDSYPSPSINCSLVMVVFDSYPSPSINCSLVMVVFDSYPSPSIKDVTSEARMATRANNKPRIFAISDKTNIERVTMGELLASKDAKKLITTYFMKTLEEHLKLRYVDFVIAGNSITRVSIGPAVTEKKNNHVEGDTLIHCGNRGSIRFIDRK